MLPLRIPSAQELRLLPALLSKEGFPVPAVCQNVETAEKKRSGMMINKPMKYIS